MTLTAELASKVEALYRENLKREFGDSLRFDPISVEPSENSEGEATFQVTIVYDGDPETLNPRKVLAIMTSLTNPLTDLGLPPTTIESYVPKSEYPLLLELRAEPPWGVDGE